MRVVVVVAHPNGDSLIHSCAAVAVAALERNLHEVTVVDLYADGFQPAMTAAEHVAYHGPTPIIDPLVTRSATAVGAAEMLVFVYPTWWSTLPAMLKGWLEKTMVPGVAFVFDQDNKVRPALTRVRHIVGISTYGSSRSYVRLVNDNGRRTLLRALRLNTGLRTRATWLALYGVDSSSGDERQEFLDRIDRRLAKL